MHFCTAILISIFHLRFISIINSSQIPSLKVKLRTNEEWIQSSLERHNYLRSLHDAPPLSINKTLCEISQSWTDQMLSKTLERFGSGNSTFFFEHNVGVLRKYRLGENLYFSTHPRDLSLNGSLAVSLWYNEIKDYDFNFARVKATSDPTALIGHFTQLVWVTTDQLGTAYSSGILPDGRGVTFIAANYYPGGNVIYSKEFPKKLYKGNVRPPIAQAEAEIQDVEQIIGDKIKFWDIPVAAVTTPQAWIDSAIEQHNIYRLHHNFPPIIESPQLSTIAQQWANKLLAKGLTEFNEKWSVEGRLGFGNYAAREKGEFGENVIYFLTSPNGAGLEASLIVNLWYGQHQFYDFKAKRTNYSLSKTARTNDFEQLIWKSSSRIGLAFSSGAAENGQILSFVVGYYYPKVGTTFQEKEQNIPDNGCDNKHVPTSIVFTAIVFVIYLQF